MYSISDILNNSISFLRDQIFEIDLEDNQDGNKFKFVQLKFKEILSQSKHQCEDGEDI